MTTETTTATAAVETKPRAVKGTAAKSAKKKGTKKGTKATAKKKTAKKGERTKKDGLRKPQVRILEALARNKNPLTRAEISEKASVDLAMLNSYIGSHDDAIRAKNDAKVMPSLRTLGYVKVEQHDIDGRDTVVHTITAAGRKALEAFKKS